MCPGCGADLPQTAPLRHDQAPVLAGARRCPDCGAVNALAITVCRNCGRPLLEGTGPPADRPLPLVVCPACGAPNSSTASDCRLCGAPLSAPAPPAEGSEARPPAPVAAPRVEIPVAEVAEGPVEMPGSGALDVGPMSLPRCLDRAFAILKRNFGDLLLAAAVVHVPMALALALMMWAQYQMNPNLVALLTGDTGALGTLWEGVTSGDLGQLGPLLLGENTIDVGTYGLVMLGNAVFYVVMWFTYPWLWGVAAVLTMQTHLGRTPDPREAWRATRSNYWQLVAVGMVYGLAYTVGSSCLWVGLLLILPLLIYLVPVVMFEGRGALDAIPRVFRLIGKDYGRIVWWYLASYAVVLGVQSGLEPAIDMLCRALLGLVLPEDSALPAVFAMSLRPLAAIVYVPLLMVFRTLMYFDARARHEAFDLQVRAPGAEGA